MPAPPTEFRITESSLDTALRYETVIGLFADRYRPDLRVLEVGAGAAGVTQFLHHPVTGVDPAFERTAERRTPHLTPVVGTATDLPFADEAFDVVLSLEMLEHVAPEDRETCLGEMLRVLRPGGRLIVSFPSDATAARLDGWLNAAYRRKSGHDHPWASEHLEHGVPSSAQVAELLRTLAGPDGTVEVHRHQSAESFRLVHGLYTARNYSKLTRLLGLHTRPAARALFAFVRHRHAEPAYRTILVADKAAQRRSAASSSEGIARSAASTPR